LAAKRDYYEILGVSKGAEQKDIKHAYRKLAKRYHPDTNSGNAQDEKKFQEITEAYTVLSDPEKRKLYDQFGHAALEPGAEEFYRQAAKNGQTSSQAGGGFGNGFGFDGGYGNFYDTGYGSRAEGEDLFGDLFGDLFRQGRGKAKREQGFSKTFYHDSASSQADADVHAELNITFDEAAFGCDRLLHLQRADGSGQTQSLQVHVPAGMEDGKILRLRGKGSVRSNGQQGDLLLKVHVGTRPGYERKGMDVYTTAQIPFGTAALGGEVQVDTLYGKVLCKIREGTASGTKIRLKGKGIVSMKDSAVHGDQYVTVQIEVPQHLSQEAKQRLREFEKAC
jgi:molecular chaperone DnaJ